MRIDREVAALQRDPASRRRAQAAMVAACDAWRATSVSAPLQDEFAQYGAGVALARCPALFGLFAENGAALRWVAGLAGALCAALTGEPFGHPPFRHAYDRGNSTLLLAQSGRAQLVLHAAEPGDRHLNVVSFADARRHEVVLAGAAEGRIVTRRGPLGRFAERQVALEAGARIALDLREEALQVLAIERRLVSLRLHRSARAPEPTREYDVSSGALLRQAAGDIRTSRIEMMLALLGRMGRREAVPAMAAIAREPGDASLRWQALRECLALDPAAGLAALGELARTAHDPLAAPAGALHAQLRNEYPALEAIACRA